MGNYPRAALMLALVATLCLGMAFGAHQQSANLNSLASEPATISKMDWILLQTRVHVLEQALKDDLALSLTSTGYQFNSATGKIHSNVYVNPSWLSQTNFDQVKEAFSRRAAALCIAPAAANISSILSLMKEPPNQYCSIRFFTISLATEGSGINRKDIATYENGKLMID